MDANHLRSLLKDFIETNGLACTLEALNETVEEVSDPGGTPIQRACYYTLESLREIEEDATQHELDM